MIDLGIVAIEVVAPRAVYVTHGCGCLTTARRVPWEAGAWHIVPWERCAPCRAVLLAESAAVDCQHRWREVRVGRCAWQRQCERCGAYGPVEDSSD